MRGRWIAIVGSIGILVGLGGLYETPALAQWARAIRPVLVKNIDERGRNPYMQFQVVACAGGLEPACAVTFPPVPDGQRLVVEHVNVSVAFAGAGVKRIGLLTPAQSIFVLPQAPTSNADLVIVNEPLLAYFESGQTPVVHIIRADAGDDVLITAAVSGYVVDLGQ